MNVHKYKKYRLTRSFSPVSNNNKKNLNLKGGSSVKNTEPKEVETEDIIKGEDDEKCAPGAKYENGSCMSLNLLIEMAKAYNDSFPNNKIELQPDSDKTTYPRKYKKNLLKQFSARLGDVCDDQICWLKQDFVKKIEGKMKDELENTFRPEGPAGSFDWLNTLNINQVVEQYQKVHPEFKFLGAVPVDFDELPELKIKDLDVEQLKKDKITKLGIVFNLDEHDKPGSHWVAAYIDLISGQVYYFDSYGIEPEPRIRKFLRRCTKYCKQFGAAKVDVRHNEKRHQRGDNACGMYSINFILRMLQGESFDKITENVTTDNQVNKLRDVFFVEEEEDTPA